MSYGYKGVSPNQHKEETRLTSMKKLTRILCATASLLAAGEALAGPPVEVTFRNLGTGPVTLELTNANETSTYQIAKPQPKQVVKAGETIMIKVQRLVSPDTNGAMLRYTDGRRTCAFSTTFVMMMSGGIKLPKWNKTATPTGGATCTAVNSGFAANYAWKAEFTMK
ncbi:hypothetical protein ACIP02_06570 [Pseudomonas sp. NPDC089408]|uniref:hypothetical protein n=2 Tax=unclassified Pseudomonas TaxID=196821 RepID=UPI00380D316C